MKYLIRPLFFFLLVTQICFAQWEWQNPLPQGNNLNDIDFVNESNGIAVGESGTIIRTTDRGVSWTIQESGTTANLTGVSFTDANTGTAVGGGGTILHTTNGGVSFVEEEQIDEVPIEFLLSQNYPNPFNPTTTIKYQIPELSFVSLKIYDVLGSEIVRLVNEEKPAGSYRVEFDAANLPSGVYFYALQANDFTQTKKMILMK